MTRKIKEKKQASKTRDVDGLVWFVEEERGRG
jgi:hypothetical protein